MDCLLYLKVLKKVKKNKIIISWATGAEKAIEYDRTRAKRFTSREWCTEKDNHGTAVGYR